MCNIRYGICSERFISLTPGKTIMPLRRKELPGVKENETTVVRRKDSKRIEMRKTDDGD